MRVAAGGLVSERQGGYVTHPVLSTQAIKGVPASSDSSRAALVYGAAPAGVAAERLPFAPGDVTGGTENELQTVVVGRGESVDLALTVEQSPQHSDGGAALLPRRPPAEFMNALRGVQEK